MTCTNCQAKHIGGAGSVPIVPACQSFATNQSGVPGSHIEYIPPAATPFIRVAASQGGKFEKYKYLRMGPQSDSYQQYVVVSGTAGGTTWTPSNNLDFVDDLASPTIINDPGDFTVRAVDALVNTNADCDSGSLIGDPTWGGGGSIDPGEVIGDIITNPWLFDSGIMPNGSVALWRMQTTVTLVASDMASHRFVGLTSGCSATWVSFVTSGPDHWLYFNDVSLGPGDTGFIAGEECDPVGTTIPGTIILASPLMIEIVG